MKTSFYIFMISVVLFKQYHCDGNIENLFLRINKQTAKFNSVAAEIAWESTVNPGNPNLPAKAADYQAERILWQHEVCDRLAHNTHFFNSTQRRQTYLLCRGPNYTFDEARKTSSIYEELQLMYTDALICVPNAKNSTNLADAHDAILNYLTAVRNYLNNDRYDYVALAAKFAVQNSKVSKGICLRGEPDLERLMEISKNEKVLQWTWLAWREKVGPPMKKPFRELVKIENLASRRNGYSDIGEAWRYELEVPDLRVLCRKLFNEIQPLYKLLHGVTRFFLRRHYGTVIPENGPIPSHLLGNMWSQNWESLADLILPETVDLDDSIKNLNWTVNHMVKRAEDFYQSLGLQPLPDKFWRNSVFRRTNATMRCHGTSADMFQDGDVRLLYCSGTSMEDFYVLHHELGHIYYFLAYAHQPALFRQANTALHESIGDTIMLGVMAPQHLHRLGLINDTTLFASQSSNVDETQKAIDSNINSIKSEVDEEAIDGVDFQDANELKNKHIYEKESGVKIYQKNFEFSVANKEKDTKTYKSNNDEIVVSSDEAILLKQALNKLPQIPFSLLIDEYRWKYFEGGIDEKSTNEEFWKMAVELQGVAPPGVRGEEYFDIGAKFHVPDNTPYIRYFLSSFLQHQLFEVLCRAAVFGRRDVTDPLPAALPLHRCDIYGSKAAGRILKDIMSKGSSESWQIILKTTTGKDEISSAPLLRYYRPLLRILRKLVRKYRIPIGW